jgi:hypothetical protein
LGAIELLSLATKKQGQASLTACLGADQSERVQAAAVKAVSELAGYSYKTLNKDTPQEVVTPDIVDASNNVADAIRYALQDLIIKEIKQPFFIG